VWEVQAQVVSRGNDVGRRRAIPFHSSTAGGYGPVSDGESANRLYQALNRIFSRIITSIRDAKTLARPSGRIFQYRDLYATICSIQQDRNAGEGTRNFSEFQGHGPVVTNCRQPRRDLTHWPKQATWRGWWNGLLQDGTILTAITEPGSEPQRLRQRTRHMRAYRYKQNNFRPPGTVSDSILEQVEGCGSHPKLMDYYRRV
jgi:hypothetical protein